MEKKNKLYTTPSSGAVSQSQPAPFSGHYTDIPGQRPSQTRGAVRCGSIYFVFVGHTQLVGCASPTQTLG